MDIEFALSGILLLQIIISVFLPLVVALITKYDTSGPRRALLLLALASFTALLTELLSSMQTGTTYNLGTGLLMAIASFVTGVGFHFGLWKDSPVQHNLLSVGSTSSSPLAQ